jgi:hypothetical protein
VERFAEIDSLACSELGAESFALTSYLIWSHDEVGDKQMTVDAVVVDDDSAPTEDLLARAHRFVFSSSVQAPTVATMLTHSGRPFTETIDADVHVFDFATPGYIVREPS